jgi:hypothetical protein
MTTLRESTKPYGERAPTVSGDVRALLDRLARAITAGDAKGIAALWEAPAMVIGLDGVVAVASLDEVARFFGGARAQYTARGITGTRADILGEERIGDRVVVVKVRWPYLDATGRERGAEASDYTLRRDDSGALKVRSVLMRGVARGV